MGLRPDETAPAPTERAPEPAASWEEDLSGDAYEELTKALLHAFPTEEALERMVRRKLSTNLKEIAIGDNLTEIAEKLIDWAQSTGATERLVKGALAANPGNPLLVAFARRRGVSPPAEQIGRGEVPGHGGSSRLARLVLAGSAVGVVVAGLLVFGWSRARQVEQDQRVEPRATSTALTRPEPQPSRSMEAEPRPAGGSSATSSGAGGKQDSSSSSTSSGPGGRKGGGSSSTASGPGGKQGGSSSSTSSGPAGELGGTLSSTSSGPPTLEDISRWKYHKDR